MPVLRVDETTAPQGHERGHSGKSQPLQSSSAGWLDNGVSSFGKDFILAIFISLTNVRELKWIG